MPATGIWSPRRKENGEKIVSDRHCALCQSLFLVTGLRLNNQRCFHCSCVNMSTKSRRSVAQLTAKLNVTLGHRLSGVLNIERLLR